jgi:hypothetical protein
MLMVMMMMWVWGFSLAKLINYLSYRHAATGIKSILFTFSRACRVQLSASLQAFSQNVPEDMSVQGECGIADVLGVQR